jgi:hypothetical protein
MLFFALFQSQVSYGISVWGRTYHYLINGILQIVQNRAIKNLFGFPFLEETYGIHKRCAIFPIALLHFERSTSLLHNVYIYSISNISLRENFQFHYHNLRNGADIRNETKNSTGLGTVPLLYSYVTSYNRVPRVLQPERKNGFKLQLKKAIRLKFNERNITVQNLQNVEYFVDNLWN